MENVLRGLFTGAEDEAIAARHKSESQKQQDIAMWQNVLHGGPDIDDEHRMRAADELAKLHGLKKGENPYKKVATVLNTLKAGIQGKVAPASVQGAGVEIAANAEQQVDPQTQANQESTQRIEKKTQSLGGKILTKVGQGLSSGLHHLNAGLEKMEEAHRNRLPSKVVDYYTGADGKRHEVMQRSDGSTFERVSDSAVQGTGAGKKVSDYVGVDNKKHTIYQRPDGTHYEEISEEEVRQTGNARPVYGPGLSVRQARELGQQGQFFIGEDGQPIDLEKLPDEMGLKRFTLNGKTVWVPFSPNQRIVTVGNESYAISPMDVGALTEGAGTDLGQKNVGSTRLPGYTGIDAAGNVQRVAGQTTPNTTGVKRSLPSLDPKYQPIVEGKKTKGGVGGTGKKSQTPAPQGKGNGLPLPASMYGKQADRATGVRLAQAALYQFRDSDLSVYDNPESVTKLRDIIGLIQKTADQQLKTGQGPMAAVETWAGLPATMNRLQQDILQDQAIQLNDQETQFLADYFYLLGSWPGMRRSVGTSPARWSMNLMFSELPTPGLVNNSKQAKARIENMEKETKQVVLPKQLRGIEGEESDKNQTSQDKTNKPPKGATHIGIGSVDHKKHYLDDKGNDLGLVQ